MDSIITQVRPEDAEKQQQSILPKFPTDGKFAENPNKTAPLVKIQPAASGQRQVPERNAPSQQPQSQRAKKAPGERRRGGLRSLLCCFHRDRRDHDSRRPVVGERSHRPEDIFKLATRSSNVRPGETDGVPPSQSRNGAALDPAQVQPMLQNDHRTQLTVEASSDVVLLPAMLGSDFNKSCLIVDLDETLVHSSFKPVDNPDFIVPVELEGIEHQVYVLKRPFVDQFLQHVGQLFECVLFTASLSKYADPVADLLDPQRKVFRSRLFREACVFHEGSYVKDLGMLGRSLKRCIIIDNSPASYAFHNDNAIPVTSWFGDPHDTELFNLMRYLEKLARVDNVYTLLSMLRQENSPSPPPSSEGSMENLNM